MDNLCYFIKNLNFGYENFSLKIEKLKVKRGEKIAILGENGSGKTTFLNVISGFFKNYSGDIIFFNKNIKDMPSTQKSRLLSYLPQFSDISFGYNVFETVLFGRLPYIVGDNFTENDIKKTETLLKKFDLIKYKDIEFNKLSGGEKRRVMVAKVLNQETEVILLDEPTSMVDIKFSLKILNFFKKLKVTVIASIHDINLAFMFFDRFLFFKNGNLIYDLNKNLVTEEVLNETFEVNFIRLDDTFIVKY